MTTKEQVLELAKKCGFCAYGEETGSYHIPVAAFESRLLAFAAAIEERNSARVAMLVDALEAQEKLSRTGLFYAKPHEIESVQELRRQALTAAQQTADAFLAERDARAMEAEITYHSEQEQIWARHGDASLAEQERQHVIRLTRIAAEKRKQAGQESGKEGG